MSAILAELLLPSFGTGLYLRYFHEMLLSLSMPSDLFMSKFDVSRGDVLGSARMEVLVQSESGSSFSLFPIRQPWKYKSDLFLKSGVCPYYFAVDPVISLDG